jgi:hypothetical protein
MEPAVDTRRALLRITAIRVGYRRHRASDRPAILPQDELKDGFARCRGLLLEFNVSR